MLTICTKHLAIEKGLTPFCRCAWCREEAKNGSGAPRNDSGDAENRAAYQEPGVYPHGCDLGSSAHHIPAAEEISYPLRDPARGA